MIWQDIVMAIANLLFTYSLGYQVYYGFKVKKGLLTLSTSGPTFIGLYAMSFAFFTLSLFFSTLVSSVNGTLWFVLFSQRIGYKKA